MSYTLSVRVFGNIGMKIFATTKVCRDKGVQKCRCRGTDIDNRAKGGYEIPLRHVEMKQDGATYLGTTGIDKLQLSLNPKYDLLCSCLSMLVK